MDSDGLPLVGPGLDLTKVQALNQRRILAFLNNYLSNTVQYLNRFSCVCEAKLIDLSVKIQRLETSLNILEAKLSSIPGLEKIAVSKPVENASTHNGEASVAEKNHTNASQQAATTPAGPVAADVRQEAAEAVQKPPTMTVAQHPKYARFFKMLQMGVPKMAVKLKMSAEGCDPNILDNPNAPMDDGAAQVGGTGVTSAGDDSDAFSDDDDDAQNSSDESDRESDAFSD